VTKWWRSAPKLAPTLIAFVLTAAPPSPFVARALAQGAPADTAAVQVPPAPAAAAAPAPAVDPKAEKARIERERKAVAEKEKADRKAKELAAAEDAKKSGIPWYKGANWMTFKLGFSGSKVKNSPDASAAAGISAQHFTSPKWALGLNADLDVLGKFGGATEMELPLTLEAQRHFRWGSDTFRPFIGFGTGVYYYRTYRTGADGTDVRPGYFLSGGFNSPISNTALLGMVARISIESGAQSDNPYFPNDSSNAVHWSLKLTYSRVR
jgi:hypothetical protein